jgi:hypothetical protein
MMALKSDPARWVVAVITVVCIISARPGLTAAEDPATARPPAGQMCPDGAHVIGFDAEANIVCSEAQESEILPAPESAGAAIEEGCKENCQSVEAVSPAPIATQSEPAETVSTAATAPIAAQAEPVETVSTAADIGLAITGVEPKSALYGARKVTLTVSGTGFGADSVVKFGGSSYSPSVNQAGTRLEVTVPTRDLSIGNYALTVSNGPGMEATRKKALVIY